MSRSSKRIENVDFASLYNFCLILIVTTLTETERIAGNLGKVNVSDSMVDRTRPSTSPEIDFELCKTSITERLKTFGRWPISAQVRDNDFQLCRM